MQRLARGVTSLLQLQRHIAADVVQQAQRAQCGLLSLPAIGTQAAAAVQQPHWEGWQQMQPLHSSACCSCTDTPNTNSSSSSRDSHWQQQHHTLVQTAWHDSHQAAGPNPSASASSSSSCLSPGGVRPFSTSGPTAQQPAAAEPADAASAAGADTSSGRGPALSPAADPKPILGVCRRRNIKCGWKKIDFVLRMIRRTTVDDAMAQLTANPKKSAVFVKHAVANARNNAICAGGDPAKLYVAEAFVTKGKVVKRLHFMGRGYSSVQQTRYSHLNVRVEQMDEQAAAAVTLRRQPRLVSPLMQRMQARTRTPRALQLAKDQAGGGGSSGGSSVSSSSGSVRQQLARA